MKLKVTELKKQLKTYDQKELIQLIADLYKINKDVQAYLSVQFMGKEAADELFAQSAKKINDEFFPDRGFPKMRLAQAKKAITDYKKLTGDESGTAELILYYIETGLEFTNAYGDIDEPFYNSLVSMYSKVINLCYKNDEYYEQFAPRLEQAISDAGGFGWGVQYDFSELYYGMQSFKEGKEE